MVRKATERYQRLSVVAEILKSDGREHYDHFLKNGFPKWRGTGYYYQRFRPGLGTVLVGLFIAGGGAAHYGALVLGYRRQREFVGKYIRHARRAAWGDETGIKGIPGLNGDIVVAPSVEVDAPEQPGPVPMNRFQKRQMEKEQKKKSKSTGKRTATTGRSAGPQTSTRSSAPTGGERKRVMAENGKVLIVDTVGNVYLEEEDEDGEPQEFLLDLAEIHKPTIYDTALVRFPVWVYRQVVGRFPRPPTDRDNDDVAVGVEHVTDVMAPTLVRRGDDPEQDSGSSFEMLEASPVQQASNGTARQRNKKKNKK